MALSKELQLKEGYQDPSQSIAFNPLTAPDASGAMKENRQTAIQNMQREDEVLKKSEQAALEFAKKTDEKTLTELSVFSTSLQETAKLGITEYWKSQAKAGIAAARNMGVPFKEHLEWSAARADLGNVDAVTDELKAQDLAAGKPFEVAHMWKGLSGLAKVYAQEEMARQAADVYYPWMSEQFKSNNTFKVGIKDADGNTVEYTPVEVAGDPVKAAIMMRALDDLFYEQYGMIGVNRSLLQEHAFKKMNDGRSKLMGEARDAFAQERSSETVEMVRSRIVSDGDLLGGVRALMTTVDKDGKPLTRAAAKKKWFELLKEVDESRNLTLEQFEAIKDQKIDGQKVGDRWKLDFDLFEQERAARSRQANKALDDDVQAAFEQAEREAIQYLIENNGSLADVQKIQERLYSKYEGRQSTRLQTFAESYSLDAKTKQNLVSLIEEKSRLGTLTTKDVMSAPPDVQRTWLPVAQAQEDMFGGAQFKTEMKAIEGLVKNDPRVKMSVDGYMGIGTLVVADLQGKARQKVSQYMGNMPMQQAILQAISEVKTEFDLGKTNPGSIYYMNNLGEFVNFLPKNAGVSSKALNMKLNRIRVTLRDGGDAALDRPGLIWNRQELESMARGYGKPGWTVPSTVQYWSNVLNKDPLELINRARKADGLKELDTPQSLLTVKNTITPGLQGLLNRFPSPNRSTRALSSAGAYNPAIVPGGYGDTILKAAQANNIDPGILAGLIQTESRFDAKAVSKAGAQGIAQIMPEYHPGVNTSDPIASINYAAKYLSQLQRQFGGDMRLALIAYNAGPDRVSRYRGPIPGDPESGAYYGKVMQAAAKYGYGQAWKDPALMRGKFRVIEHLSGDSSHGSYRADHGGSRYHDHIAFATKAERDAAIQKLRAAGIEVGSVDRPGDKGYHGSEQAIDIPASQVPVGKEQELSRRVRSILGIS